MFNVSLTQRNTADSKNSRFTGGQAHTNAIFNKCWSPATQYRYSAIYHVLWEEFFVYSDPATATLGAFAIALQKEEHPERVLVLSEGCVLPRSPCTRPGDRTWLQVPVHTQPACQCGVRCGSALQNRKPLYAGDQEVLMVWEICMHPTRRPEGDSRVLGIHATEGPDLPPEGNEMHHANTATPAAPQGYQQDINIISDYERSWLIQPTGSRPLPFNLLAEDKQFQ